MNAYMAQPMILLALLSISLNGCIGVTFTNGHLTTPHEAFVQQYGRLVGHSLDYFREVFSRKYGFAPLTEKKLPNGNYEIEIDNALARRKCKIFYEYNPSTKIIVNWRFEGTDDNSGCAVNPYT